MSNFRAAAVLIFVAACSTTGGGVQIPVGPPGAPQITFGQVFDANVPAPAAMKGKVGFIWADNHDFGAVPGVETGQYTAGYRADPAHSTAWFLANHPDWIAYQGDGATIPYEFGDHAYTPIDFANPAARAWKEAQIDAGTHGQGWVSVDNIDLENSFHNVGYYAGARAPCTKPPACGGKWTVRYTGKPLDPAWIADNVAYVAALRAHFNAAGRKVMINNAGGSSSVHPSDHIALAAKADGSMSEGFPIDDCAGRPVDHQFDTEYAEASAESASPWFAVGYLCGHPASAATPSEIAWATSTFLLASRAPAINYLGVTGGSGQPDQSSLVSYGPAWNPPLGPATEPPPAAGSRPYIRHFQAGTVILNASSAPVTVSIAAGRHDQFGAPLASRLTLAPASAVIVL